MMNRQEAARALVGALTDQIVVTGLGNVANDIYAAGDRALKFYTRGSMGTAASIALGLARSRPNDRVVCVEGDGSLLMNLGTLATIGRTAPSNLACFIWDNERFQITGGQATNTRGGSTDLAGVSRACGIPRAELVSELTELEAAVERVLGEAGPSLVVAKVDDRITDAYLPRKPVVIKHRFMRALGTLPDVDRLD